MRTPRNVLLVAVLVLNAAPTLAQTDRAGVAVRLVPGILYGSARFGDESTEKSAFNIGGQFWAPMTRSLGFVIEGVWQPTKVENPHESIDEAFRPFYLLGGFEFAGEDEYLRLSVGLALLFWSGADAPEGTEMAPVLGLAIGSERPLGGFFHISPELELRMAPFEAFVLALQLPVGWRAAGQQ